MAQNIDGEIFKQLIKILLSKFSYISCLHVWQKQIVKIFHHHNFALYGNRDFKGTNSTDY